MAEQTSNTLNETEIQTLEKFIEENLHYLSKENQSLYHQLKKISANIKSLLKE